MIRHYLIAAAAGSALLAGTIAFGEDEQKIAVKDLPQKIVDGVKGAFKDGAITAAEKETKKDKTVYEVDVTSGGKAYEMKLAEDGTVLKQELDDEQDVATKDLPQKVVDAVKTAYKDGAITEAEKKDKDKKAIYEVDVTSGGKKYEMKIAEDGTVLKQKEEKEDDDD